MKMKVVIWCRKKWNEHNLMYIYHKQCEIKQKIQWNSSNGQLHWFPIDFLWKWPIMDQNCANANAWFSDWRKKLILTNRFSVCGTPQNSWKLSTAHSENSEIGHLSCFIEFFVWFHIVCDRYTSDYAHFTFSDTIWPLSLSWVWRTHIMVWS